MVINPNSLGMLRTDFTHLYNWLETTPAAGDLRQAREMLNQAFPDAEHMEAPHVRDFRTSMRNFMTSTVLLETLLSAVDRNNLVKDYLDTPSSLSRREAMADELRGLRLASMTMMNSGAHLLSMASENHGGDATEYRPVMNDPITRQHLYANFELGTEHAAKIEKLAEAIKQAGEHPHDPEDMDEDCRAACLRIVIPNLKQETARLLELLPELRSELELHRDDYVLPASTPAAPTPSTELAPQTHEGNDIRRLRALGEKFERIDPGQEKPEQGEGKWGKVLRLKFGGEAERS